MEGMAATALLIAGLEKEKATTAAAVRYDNAILVLEKEKRGGAVGRRWI